MEGSWCWRRGVFLWGGVGVGGVGVQLEWKSVGLSNVVGY